MNREYHKWHSPALQRDMELLVFGTGGRPVLFFPTRMARFYDYENWGILAALEHKLASEEIQLFCVDSVDAESFYNTHVHPEVRIARHVQYEDYLITEVVPFIKQKNSNAYIEAAGCSMGAYHALNIALKHPDIFKKAVSMSGRYDLTEHLADFRDLFDGYHNQQVYFNMPRQYVANMHEHSLLEELRSLTIILAVGQTDPFLFNNQEISRLLWDKGIPNEFYVWDGYAHRPRYWKKMVELYL
ncbi:esterase [Mucilaginibacter pedocola]|uniref:Esterase n=1 Tax=Mucilaginibacter pedocola TaxID=1792845 RepID=A0A1S9P8D5_9SPHI|nr:esterase [Mucilaginibacter pedocola]